MKSKLLLLPLLLWMFAITANPQVTVNVTNKSVRETLKEIEKKSEYKFFFNESLAGLEKRTLINDADITLSTL